MTRRWALGAVALVATVILRGATWQDQGITALKERSGDWMEGSRRHRGRVHGQRDPALLDAESAAAQAEKSMLKDGPAAEKATDDYTAARMRLTTLRTKLRDNTDVRKQLMLVEKRRQAQVAEAKQKRDDATKSVGTEDSTLQEAQKIAKHARRRERTSRQERSESEKAEAQGLALQQPAAALLKDSQRLNDQSNLVLDQSHSAQAKALAALDLKLAQNLAGRASKGMAEAKRDFAKAISDRKAAVADDAVSAHEVRQVAQVSLKTNKEQPALLHVLHGQMTGGAALHAVVNTDTNGVLNAEETLGVTRDEVIEDERHVADVDTQIAVLSRQAKALRAEVRAAEKEVLEAARGHVSALRAYKQATATALSSQSQLNDLQEEDMKTLKGQRDAATLQQKQSGERYRSALANIAKLNGHQTVLKVEIARLRLQLKEADLQRREEDEKASRAQDTINNMQAQLDKEDADLNQARLQLADAHLGEAGAGTAGTMTSGAALGVHSLATAAIDEAEPAREHAAERWRARGEDAERGGWGPMGETEGEGDEDEEEGGPAARDGHSFRSKGHMQESLDQQRRDDERLSEEEERAHRRARMEEAKLKAAQQQVAQQLSKITNLEGSMQ